MTIEFKCPFCTAMIRVPDNAGGGKGRCPKCAMRISVPKRTAVKSVLKTPVKEEPFVLPVAAPDPDETPVPGKPKPAQPAFTEAPSSRVEELPPFDPMVLSKLRLGELPVYHSAPVASAARRLKKKAGPRHLPWTLGAGIGLILLVAGVYYAYPNMFADRLTGDLVARSAASLELPPILIEKSRFKLSSEDVTRLLTKLELSPVPLNSSSMQIQLTGTEKGLMISVAAGPQAHFYRVSLKDKDSIEKYLSRHASEMESQRARNIDRAATNFLLEYDKVLAKKTPPDSITPFRDSLALPTLVSGFGQELVAAYGRGLYRCAYEDRDGALYFLLPEGVKEFQLIGRKHADGTVIVPAELNVKVQGEIAQSTSRSVEKNSDKNKSKPAEKEVKIGPEVGTDEMPDPK